MGGSAAFILPVLHQNYLASVIASNVIETRLIYFINVCPVLVSNCVQVLKMLHTVDLQNPSCVFDYT